MAKKITTKIYTTGYFARAGMPDNKTAMATKVHALCNGKAMCGYKPHKTMSFQWNAHGLVSEYIDCQRCKKLVVEMRAAEMVAKKQAVNKLISVNTHEQKVLLALLNTVVDSDYFDEVRPKYMSKKHCDEAANSLWDKLSKL